MRRSPDPETLEEVSRHYLQAPGAKEVLVLEGLQDGKLVALVVPDLDYFRKTGETAIQGEAEWQLEYLSQQLEPHQRISHFELTNRELPRNQQGEIDRRRAAALYQELAERRGRRKQPVRKKSPSTLSNRVFRVLQEKTGAAEIYPEDRLELDLGLDSLALVELLAALEETCGIPIEEGECLGIFTVGELIGFLKAKEAAGGPPAGKGRTWAELLQSPLPRAFAEHLALNEVLKGRLFTLGASLWARSLFKLAFGLRVQGRKRLGPGSYILCPNHGSFLDGFLLFAAVPHSVRSRLYFLGYQNYFEGPVAGPIAKWMHVVPVNSARHLVPAMQVSAHILKRGGVLGIFPEGSRTLTGELRPFKRGVATLAQEVGVPLVPVYIHGSYQAWGPNARYPRPHRIRLVFGREFSARDLADRGRHIKPAAQTGEAITLGLRQEILKLKFEAGGRGAQPPALKLPPPTP